MNTFLWALQVILAVKLLTVTFNHGLRPDPVKMKRGRDWLGAAARPLLGTVALLAMLVALALILPHAQGFLPWTASLAALMMLLATGFHLRCREEPKVWVSLILFGLAVILAYGRWTVSPL